MKHVLLILFALGGFFPSLVSAQSPAEQQLQIQGLAITPFLIETKVEPGRSQEQALIIRVEGESIPEGRAGIIEWQGLDGTYDPFNSFIGSDGLRMALAARVVEAHGGSAERKNGALLVRLPLATRDR